MQNLTTEITKRSMDTSVAIGNFEDIKTLADRKPFFFLIRNYGT
jgi:hypothetical protein